MKDLIRRIRTEKVEKGFVPGALSGALLMFAATTFFLSSNPFYPMTFFRLNQGDVPPAAAARIEAASERFAEALALAELSHVSEDLDEAMVSRMLDAALSEMDPFSGFLDRDAARAMIEVDAGEDRPRLGVSVMDVEGRYTIESVFPGSPAERVGMMPGDRVVRIGDLYVGEMDPVRVNEILKSEIERSGGAPLTIGIRRPGEPREVGLVVDPETVRLIAAHDLGVEDGVLHLHLERFYEGAADDVAVLIERARRDTPLSGVVIDLRGDGGGLTSEARRLADKFLDGGLLIYATTGRTTGEERFETSGNPEFGDLGLAVIIDGGTASAAEIFSAAIQAHGRGKIVGWRSYGKGTVQRIFPVAGGAVKVTASTYRDGALREIDHLGIAPDVAIEGTDPMMRPSRFSVDPARDAARRLAAGEGE